MTALLVASPGGHLEELRVLAPQLGVDPHDCVWVTSRTAQSESLLADQPVHWVPHVAARQGLRALNSLPQALRLHRQVRPRVVISTGAALAAPHLVAAALFRSEVRYIESATRLHGPSVTGRAARMLPGTQLFAQGSGWGDARWLSTPGVFDAFAAVPRPQPVAANDIKTALVTLGTERFPFERAVRSVREALPRLDTSWQTGNTVVTDGAHELQRWMPAEQLRRACREADVVITHGGVGSVLVALDEGKVPVVLPRSGKLGEHIDEHQHEIADLLAARSLAITTEPGELCVDHLVEAANLTAVRSTAPAEVDLLSA